MTAQSLQSYRLVGQRPCSVDAVTTIVSKWQTHALFALATVLGAFLVFQVQPVISKSVLPWFGGTPAVWTTCMLFFQVLLFGGYLYAHVLRSCFRPQWQALIHVGLLASAALTLPIEPSDAWRPSGQESPMLYLLWMLIACVGLPYFVLSSTGPLIQSWMSYQSQGTDVYRLYALSNAGSLVALLSYPFVVEPFFSVSQQSLFWSLLFLAFVLLQGSLAMRLLRLSDCPRESTTERDDAADEKLPSLERRLAWIGLPAFASIMLLVVTNHVCQDVAVIPFFWVLPLALYLMSFIITFDSPQWYHPKIVAVCTLVAVVVIQAKGWLPGSTQLLVEASGYMVMLLGSCLLAHGELARLKPASRFLTKFYALTSAGGALGGLVVAVLCPSLLSNVIELPVSIAATTVFAFVVFFACRTWRGCQYEWTAIYRLRVPIAAMLIAPVVAFSLAPQDEVLDSRRNFFGVVRVIRDDAATRLVHGRTTHGIQRHGKDSSEPTAYYGRRSGVGQAIAAIQSQQPELQMGVVGLGCGVLAAYGRKGDSIDMIDINPDVIEVAQEHFTFLKDSAATVRTHLGDGRLLLERMNDVAFDLLVLDAFSSDAIPAHLLTREAMQVYRERVKMGGLLAFHVSNNHLDLVPLVHRLASDIGLESRVLRDPGDESLQTKHSTWVLVGTGENPLWAWEGLSQAELLVAGEAEGPLWTDQHHNLVSVLRLW